MSTVSCLRALGAQIAVLQADGAPALDIVGVGQSGFTEAANILDAGNSGTTMRLMAGVLAGQPFFSVLTGDDSLRSRPMGRIAEPLRAMGAHIWGRKNDTLAPLAIRGGNLQGINYRMPVASAQVKSSILLAGLFARGDTVVEERAPTRDHTEVMLREMGVQVETSGRSVALHPPSWPLPAVDFEVPADLSSGAFFLVAAAIHPNARIEVANVGLSPGRTGILDVLQAMGARLSLKNQRTVGHEPVADVVIESSALVGTEIGGDMVPRLIDEVPVVAVAAAVARGDTVIRDAAELRVKESDRIATTVEMLTRLGARVEERPDGMIIHGGAQLKGAAGSSHGDHRLAMTLAVAGMVAKGDTVISQAEAADISYPGFWDELQRLGRT